MSAPITADKRCHVTQPCVRVNVSCSRAGHKGATGGRGDQNEEDHEGWVPGQQRTAEGGYQGGYQTRVPELGRDRAGQGRTGPERDSIALKSQMKSLP